MCLPRGVNLSCESIAPNSCSDCQAFITVAESGGSITCPRSSYTMKAGLSGEDLSRDRSSL